MYQISVDGNVLYDPHDTQLTVTSPKCKLAVNTVGEASFVIHVTHPHFSLEESQQMHKLRSIFEILQDGTPIFRGRMTDDSRDFNNSKSVDLEGVLGFFNDSVIPPFVFPDDFDGATEAENQVEFFLNWLIEKHNEQVEPFQQFQLGRVTVRDSVNLERSIEDYTRTWEVLKTRLFESALGGYLCIRYEYDAEGNPINIVDYLADFKTDDGAYICNTQKISFGENLFDLVHDSDATETYSAVIPLGKKGETSRLTMDDSWKVLQGTDEGKRIIKDGKVIYSEEAVALYGFIVAPPSETTWDDVETDTAQLQKNGLDFLVNKAMKLANTITAKAVDLHFSNEEIEALRIYRYIQVESKPHDLEELYKLEQLEIDIHNPQSTVITIGDTQLSMTDINANIQKNVATQAAIIKNDVKAQVSETIAQEKTSIIEQTEDAVLVKVSEEYVVQSEFNAYKQTTDAELNSQQQTLDEQQAALEAQDAELTTQKTTFTTYKEQTDAELKAQSDQISMNFTTTTEKITEVNGNIQTQFNEFYKYIQFSEEGIHISGSKNTLTLSLDNDTIAFKQNGEVVGKWDGTNFHTGNIMVSVEERAQFGNFAFVPRPDGSLSFLKVGG